MSEDTQAYGAAPAPLRLFLPLQPVPAQRPRVRVFGKFASTYYPANHKNYATAAKKLLPKPPAGYQASPLVWVELEFRFRKARTSKLPTPVPDIDNLTKLILDVLTDLGYWPDDKYVVGLRASKRFATNDEQEGTEIHLHAL